MSSSEPGSTRLTDDSELNLAALRRALLRTSGFALYIVVCDGPARAEALRRLQAWSGKDGVPELRFFPGGRDGGAAVERFLAWEPKPPIAGAVLEDGDALIVERTPILALNAARDRLDEFVAGPLVLVVSTAGFAEFAHGAVDLFDVRSATYVVEAVPAADEAATDEPFEGLRPFLLAASLQAPPSPDQLRALEASSEPPPAGALADAWLALAVVAVGADDVEGAVEAAENAGRLARSVGYTNVIAQALMALAWVAKKQGEQPRALELVREAARLVYNMNRRGPS